MTFNSSQSAGSLVHLETSDGEDVFTLAPSKRYESVAFSSSVLTRGASYRLYTGGSCTGTQTDGLYEGGTYTAGTQYASFTINSTVTEVSGGSSGGGGGDSHGGGGTTRPGR